ncbi:ATP-dependent Clp protease proteolytic subunit [Candidatus Saccharibacteria bacterium]|nr:ATP-dependent Clp protease proteolytic subunit [Candidatus Saccharibacteria bacterium]
MVHELPKDCRVTLALEDYEHYLDTVNRRLYLTSLIETSDNESAGYAMSSASCIVDSILAYNRKDAEDGIAPQDRKPIRLYINSPGGDVTEGFAVIGAIELSQTPVYTINIGQWSSMAFLIGITGHKRLSLPNMTFLMHDGKTFTYDSGKKAQDRMDFEKRFEQEVVRAHVLKYSKMKQLDYDALVRVEYYMLPNDAMERGFIDEIVTDINAIL